METWQFDPCRAAWEKAYVEENVEDYETAIRDDVGGWICLFY